MFQPKILVISGSSRQCSFNRMLARLAGSLLEAAGAVSSHADLAAYDLPIYSGDIEKQGLPPGALKLRLLFKEADGLFIASPEHNMSVSALLKNAIDWTSRADGAESGRVPFDGKTATLCSASSGALGGQRGMLHLRLVLTGLGMHVLPNVLGIGTAGAAFTPEGNLIDSKQNEALRGLASACVSVTQRLRSPMVE